MKAIRKSDGKVIEVSSVEYTDIETKVKSRYCAAEGEMYPLSDLDFSVGEEKESEGEVLSGWAARDWNGSLYLYCHKPERNFAKSLWEGEIMSITPSDDMFPNVMWSSEPMEVEITIKPKKK